MPVIDSGSGNARYTVSPRQVAGICVGFLGDGFNKSIANGSISGFMKKYAIGMGLGLITLAAMGTLASGHAGSMPAENVEYGDGFDEDTIVVEEVDSLFWGDFAADDTVAVDYEDEYPAVDSEAYDPCALDSLFPYAADEKRFREGYELLRDPKGREGARTVFRDLEAKGYPYATYVLGYIDDAGRVKRLMKNPGDLNLLSGKELLQLATALATSEEETDWITYELPEMTDSTDASEYLHDLDDVVKSTNDSVAMKLFELSYEKGEKEAIRTAVSHLFYNGMGFIDRKRREKGLELYNTGVLNGDAGSIYSIGSLHSEGILLPLDEETAMEYYEQAVKGGNSSAMLNLGIAYYSGCGRPYDKEKALELFRLAAQQDHTTALRLLAFNALSEGDMAACRKYIDQSVRAGDEIIYSAMVDDLFDQGVATHGGRDFLYYLYSKGRVTGMSMDCTRILAAIAIMDMDRKEWKDVERRAAAGSLPDMAKVAFNELHSLRGQGDYAKGKEILSRMADADARYLALEWNYNINSPLEYKDIDAGMKAAESMMSRLRAIDLEDGSEDGYAQEDSFTLYDGDEPSGYVDYDNVKYAMELVKYAKEVMADPQGVEAKAKNGDADAAWKMYAYSYYGLKPVGRGVSQANYWQRRSALWGNKDAIESMIQESNGNYDPVRVYWTGKYYDRDLMNEDYDEE